MSLCSGSESDNVISFCPNLDRLILRCCHIQPSTVSFLGDGLEYLDTIDVGNCSGIIDLSEEDIAALQTIDLVFLENISGGMRVISEIGTSVVSVKQLYPDKPSAFLDIVNCQNLMVVWLQMRLGEVKKFLDLHEKLPDLQVTNVKILEPGVKFEDIEDVALHTLKTLRLWNCPEFCLVFPIFILDLLSIDKEMNKIKSKIIERGGLFSFAMLQDGSPGACACDIYLPCADAKYFEDEAFA